MIVGKPGRFEILYPCFWRLIGIPSLQFNNGCFGELVPLAMSRCVYLFRGDALGNQEIFDTLSAKVRQALIIFTRATLISKGAEREFRVGVVLKILFESTGKGCERSLLTAYKPECWVLLCGVDRKSTRLNSSHSQISYAVFCLKKKKKSICLPMFTAL